MASGEGIGRRHGGGCLAGTLSEGLEARHLCGGFSALVASGCFVVEEERAKERGCWMSQAVGCGEGRAEGKGGLLEVG
eukprot:631016-Prorocentrum_minimum.AAC.4